MSSQAPVYQIVSIEDNPTDVVLLRHALWDSGLTYKLSVYSDGPKAIEYLDDVSSGEKTIPDLVVLDLNIPCYGGLEILSRMKSSPSFSNVPVAVLTTSTSPNDQKAARILGASHYLIKPLTLLEFLQLGEPLKALCQKNRLHRAAESKREIIEQAVPAPASALPYSLFDAECMSSDLLKLSAVHDRVREN